MVIDLLGSDLEKCQYLSGRQYETHMLFLSKSDTGVLPALEINDTKISGGLAIARYLSPKWFYPQEADQWIDHIT